MYELLGSRIKALRSANNYTQEQDGIHCEITRQR